MKAVIYARVAQANPTSMAAQRERCEAYAREHELTVSRIYTDIGKSRHSLDVLLGEAAQEDVTALVVNSVDRLGRKADECIRYLTALDEAGVTLHNVDSSGSDRFPRATHVGVHHLRHSARRLSQ